MSKPVSINQYHLGLGLPGVFLLLVGLGEGGSWFGLGFFRGFLLKRLSISVFSTLRCGASVFFLKPKNQFLLMI